MLRRHSRSRPERGGSNRGLGPCYARRMGSEDTRSEAVAITARMFNNVADSLDRKAHAAGGAGLYVTAAAMCFVAAGVFSRTYWSPLLVAATLGFVMAAVLENRVRSERRDIVAALRDEAANRRHESRLRAK